MGCAIRVSIMFLPPRQRPRPRAVVPPARRLCSFRWRAAELTEPLHFKPLVRRGGDLAANLHRSGSL